LGGWGLEEENPDGPRARSENLHQKTSPNGRRGHFLVPKTLRLAKGIGNGAARDIKALPASADFE
jgi:hypothetical protein